jgi:tetratricopeptide (TPR) repeat protein
MKRLADNKLEGDIQGMSRATNNAAICYWDIGEKEKAVELFKESIDYGLICQDEVLINTYLNLCELYEEMGLTDKIKEVIGDAEEKMMKQNNTQGLIQIFIAKFDYSVKKAKYDRAEVYGFIALDYIQKSGNKKSEVNLYIKLSEMYRKMGDEKSSIDYLIKAKSLSTEN